MPSPLPSPAIDAVHPYSKWPTSHVVDESGCWLYTGKTDPVSGYALGKHDGRRQYVHRLMYRLHRGAIPDGLTIDHIDCVAVHCVNPWHLEPVTLAENSRRMQVRLGIAGRKAPRRREMCQRGIHDMSTTRRIRKNGTSLCGACANDYQKAWRSRQKERPPAHPA